VSSSTLKEKSVHLYWLHAWSNQPPLGEPGSPTAANLKRTLWLDLWLNLWSSRIQSGFVGSSEQSTRSVDCLRIISGETARKDRHPQPVQNASRWYAPGRQLASSCTNLCRDVGPGHRDRRSDHRRSSITEWRSLFESATVYVLRWIRLLRGSVRMACHGLQKRATVCSGAFSPAGEPHHSWALALPDRGRI